MCEQKHEGGNGARLAAAHRGTDETRRDTHDDV